MGNYSELRWNTIRTELMERCFEGFSEIGLHGTGIRTLAKHCGYTTSMIYTYFNDLDDLIVKCTEHGMTKVEEDFLSKAPANLDDLDRFLDEIPRWNAEKHGKKYRFMYQVYTHPKYLEQGKKFFDGVNKRYAEYAEANSKILGIPVDTLRPMIFTFIRICVHYALFENEFYLEEQIRMLKKTVRLFYKEYTAEAKI